VVVSLAGGRRDRTDQVGFERSSGMFSLGLGGASGEGLGDSLTEAVVDLFAEVLVEL
jgi:hypothetical protein